MTHERSVAIVGLGWLGLPLAKALLEQGYTVKGSTTSDEKARQLQATGIDARVLQLSPAPASDPVDLLTADTVVINIPPRAGQQGDHFHPQQVGYLVDIIRELPVRQVIYVSSTSVYQERLEPVSPSVETDVVLPGDSAAPALVEAEQTVLSLGPERRVVVLRCGGLMGYGRIPGKYVAGKTVDSGKLPVNYIYRDDVVAILAAMINQPTTGTFNAVAPEHPIREAVYRQSCETFGYPMPTFVVPDGALPYKMISPAKLIEATGYSFLYPNPLDFPYQL